MIKPEQVPPGLALIARKAWAEGVGPTNDDDWNAAIAAALNAWPEAEVHNFDGWTHAEGLVLPLTQQASDDQ